MRTTLFGIALCVSAGIGCASSPRENSIVPPNVIAQVEEFAEVLLEEETTPGFVLGVATREGRWIQGFGRRSFDDPRPPESTTLFEIGSISKVFTALLLLEAEAQGEVQLDDHLTKHVPEGINVPEEGQPIRLVHLALHASGLPRMPLTFKPADPSNPFAGFSPEQPFEWLQATRVKNPPLTQYVYSNFAVGLLGEVLVRAAGVEDYDQLLQLRLTEPLGLDDTTASPSPEQQTRVAQAHDTAMFRVPSWTFDVFAGAGAIRSNMEDMLDFGLSQIDPNPLHAAAQEVRFKPEEPPVHMALGWHVNAKTGTLWHNGQTGGYHSMLALSPEKGLVVCILSNSADGSCERLANGCYQLMCGNDPSPPLQIRRSGHPKQQQLEQLVGVFKIAPMARLTITREDHRVFAKMTFQQRLRIFPTDDDGLRFFYRGIDAEISFEQDESGEISSLTLHQNGRDMRGPRIE